MAIYPAQARWKALIARNADIETCRLADVLAVRRSADGWCYDNRAQLAMWARVNEKTITDRLGWLSERGIVQIKYRRSGKSYEYRRRILPINEWQVTGSSSPDGGTAGAWLNAPSTTSPYGMFGRTADHGLGAPAAGALLLPRGEEWGKQATDEDDALRASFVKGESDGRERDEERAPAGRTEVVKGKSDETPSPVKGLVTRPSSSSDQGEEVVPSSSRPGRINSWQPSEPERSAASYFADSPSFFGEPDPTRDS